MAEIDITSKTVLKINTSSGSGSGFYYKPNDLVVTNHHVVSGFRKVAVETQDKKTISANVVLINPLLDIAILKTEKVLDLPEVSFQTLNNLKNRDNVSVLGFPLGMPFTVTEGIVSSTKQIVSGQSYIQIDAAVNPGNSGGPVVNAKGDIIGITTCKIPSAENMGFALPIDHVINELDGLKQNPNFAYAVKCPSCNFSIHEPVEHCSNCGSKLNPDLFKEAPKSKIAVFVEEVFGSLNIDPVIARRGVDYWEFHQGSALIRYFVYRNNFLVATSPLVKLPKTNLKEFYEYILSDPVSPFTYAIYDGKVFISYRVSLSDLNGKYKKDIQSCFSSLALKADEVDNFLVNTYKCEWTEDSII